jgi:hypothetical protein
VKVEIAQIIKAAGQNMNPIKVRLKPEDGLGV